MFVTPVTFNPFSGCGATFSSLFHGWPKDRLATVHNDRAPSSLDVCERYFVLGSEELDLVPPFKYLRRRSRRPEQTRADGGERPTIISTRARWKDAARVFFLGDSIPERARLTTSLERWIAEFQPDLLFTILGSNGMMSLIEQIRARFDLPLVVHIMDDWPGAGHRSGLFAPIERSRMERWVKHFFSIAESCLGISPAMCEAYAGRYGRSFAPFQYALDIERWSAVAKCNLSPAPVPEFLYVGSIFRNAQFESLLDCARAIVALNNDGFPARLRIVTSADNCARYRHLLQLHPNISVEISTSDDDAFFQSLANADALLLPVNFDKSTVEFIRYSMPTKVPAYLNSRTPVLVYGPAQTAQGRYAIDAGWALVVSEHSHSALKAGLKRIVQDFEPQTKTVRRRAACRRQP